MNTSEMLLEQSLRDSPSTADLRYRMRMRNGESKKTARPSSAGDLGVGPRVGHRGASAEDLPVCAMFSQEFVRMKQNLPFSRPVSAYARTPEQQKAATLAESEGYTVTDRLHIRNDKIGFIQDGQRFPWQESRAQMANVRALPMAQKLSSFKELPAEEELATEVETALDGVYQSYFPVSRLWTLRDEGRLMTEVESANVQGQRGGEITFTTGQMPGWRVRETNLMQLMTLLRRTCSLNDEALDKLRPQLISLAEDANPIISRGRFFAIMDIMLSQVGVQGNDADTMERMSRVFNTSGDLRLTFHEMLDGLAILLGGAAEQKFELFFLMYQHVDPRRVGSGALLDRQNGQTGQTHAAASQFCVYKMMTEINRQIIDPILGHTGLEGKFWRKKAAEEISSFVEDMRYSGHEMLTFAQLWNGLSTPRRHRSWLVELIGMDQIQLIETGVDTGAWKIAFGTTAETEKSLRTHGTAIMAANRTRSKSISTHMDREAAVERARAAAAHMENAEARRRKKTNPRPQSVRKKESMSFRRNIKGQKPLHKGAATLEEAKRASAAAQGKGRAVSDRTANSGGNEMRKDLSGEESAHSAAVPLYTIALRAAAKAKDEVESGGVTWEFDAALPKPAGQQGLKQLRWKRFDPVTEMTCESAFQANTHHVTMSSATWLLGEEFVRHEGDGAAVINFLPEATQFEGDDWFGMVLVNKRSGRRRRVRRIYRLDLGEANDDQLANIVANIAIVARINTEGCMPREALLDALTAQELTLYQARRRLGLVHDAEKSQQLTRNQVKETFSIIFEQSNAGGMADVLVVLKELRARMQAIVRAMHSPKRQPTVPASKLLWQEDLQDEGGESTKPAGTK